MGFKNTPEKTPDVWFKLYKAHIDKLIELYPEAFNKEYPLPLALGVHKTIQKAVKWPPYRLHAVMAIWTSRMEYNLMANTTGKRYSLEGKEVSSISEEHQNQFIIRLNMFKNRQRIADFCKDYSKQFKRLPLACVPIKSRPNLSRFF